MKKIISVLALAAFTFGMAQETPKKDCCAGKGKKECKMSHKKDSAVSKKDCTTKHAKSYSAKKAA